MICDLLIFPFKIIQHWKFFSKVNLPPLRWQNATIYQVQIYCNVPDEFLFWSPTWGFKSYLKKDRDLSVKKEMTWFFPSLSEIWRLWTLQLRGYMIRVHKVQTLLSKLRNLYWNRVCPWKLKASVKREREKWQVGAEWSGLLLGTEWLGKYLTPHRH